jgi:molybdate transport system ATP-binding protein
MDIHLNKLSVDFDGRFQLKDIDWQINFKQHWMIVGANGAGKSALAAVLCGLGDITRGSIQGLPPRVAIVSSQTQAELIAQELKKDNADILNVLSQGTPSSEILAQDCPNPSLKNQLVKKFGFEPLMNRALRKLSSGETRKLMLIKALASEPDLLILDEPFSGLDADTTMVVQQHLESLADSVPMVLVLNRLDQCPDFVSNIAFVQGGQLRLTIARDDEVAHADLYKLLHLKTTDLDVPPADSHNAVPALDPQQPLVKLSNVAIRYTHAEIFSDLNWTIEANQHWQLSGANGSGKTSLLSLITGDHPQCYNNDILVFGYKRGSGESIWQIKQFIGFVSSALHWDYRVNISIRNVIISGFYDSIGLYAKATLSQQLIADQWLALLAMSDHAQQPFNELSYGDQRLLLIARAMVKQPPLLILDEPCLGLDEMNRQLVIALIEKICAGQGTSVIYVNHHSEDKIDGIDNYFVLDQSPSVDDNKTLLKHSIC